MSRRRGIYGEVPASAFVQNACEELRPIILGRMALGALGRALVVCGGLHESAHSEQATAPEQGA